MSNIILAVVGADKDAEDIILKSLKDFPSIKARLITENQHYANASKIKETLNRFGIETTIQKIGNIRNLEELFVVIKLIKESEKQHNIIINVDTDYMSSCLALSSAFVNGIQAIGLMEETLIAYPIMKFSYYTALSDKKLLMLNKIYKKKEYETIESLGKDLKMNLPITAYHINGAPGKIGLEEMGLVETKRSGRKIKVKLTKLGELLMKGTIEVN